MRDIEKTLGNPCNYVFCFDRIQAQAYRNQGFDTVYHLPLGINAKRYENIRLSSEQRSKYGSQVSFIGSLYEGQYPDREGEKSFFPSQRFPQIMQRAIWMQLLIRSYSYMELIF